VGGPLLTGVHLSSDSRTTGELWWRGWGGDTSNSTHTTLLMLLRGMNLAKMPGGENALNVPGTPGVFLYLLPLGSGQSKGDNLHHWGTPFHAFW
jgi:hypothetical protein